MKTSQRKLLILPILASAGLFAFGIAAAEEPSVSVRHDVPPEGRLTSGEHTADLGDVRLWYKVAGRGPFVLASSVSWGLGSGYLAHAGGIAPLERHFTMIYVNSRGTPPSSRPADPTRMSTSLMVDDLERLRQYLKIERLDLLGHSAGAMIVLGYAERYPLHARKLVLLDGALLDTFPSRRTDEIIDGWRADPRYIRAIARSDHPEYPPTDAGFTQYLGDILPLYFRDPERFLPAFRRTLTNGVEYWANVHNDAADKLAPMPQSRELDRVTAKTLVIVGRADFVCPVEVAEQMARGIAGAKLVVFEKTGHMPWIEERTRFFRVVRGFLRD
ncbi:MAG: alpha/beta hydrolase [Gammaproteobacteria bacterium]